MATDAHSHRTSSGRINRNLLTSILTGAAAIGASVGVYLANSQGEVAIAAVLGILALLNGVGSVIAFANRNVEEGPLHG